MLLFMCLERMQVTFTTFCYKWGKKRREITYQTALKPCFVEIQGYNV